MDLSKFETMTTVGEKEPAVLNGKDFDWDVPLRRIPSYNMSGLYERIEILRKENKTLRCSLARKYSHCDKLKAENRELNRLIHSLNDDVLISQSSAPTTNSEPGLTMSESAPAVEQQITAFADQDAGWKTEIHGNYDATMDKVETSNSDLGSFLQRPIRQSVQTWLINQPLYYKFNPWKEFMENPFIRNKIANYELVRCKMHCKMVISGTKFHYGRALTSYNPLSGFDQVTVERNYLDQDLVQASQKPHFFLNPTKNTGGEICMPFFWEKNYLSLSDKDYENMGELTIKSFGNLLHANGGNDPVTVTIYLWAEDVVLTMPTSLNPIVTLESQSGKKNSKTKLSSKNQSNSITTNDEYGSGIISKPAAVIAKAAGLLSDLPLIRPYALATQMVAGRVGEVAKIFGYSRPSVVSDIQLFKPNPTGNMANSDAADAVHKLTLDSKSELTLDSRTTGLDGVDQMGILDIAQRESYLTSFAWNPDEGPDTLLWNTRITPMLYAVLNTEIHPTPMSMLASNFEYWSGSLRFRFQIVKSDFHKGRLLVRYDPNYNSSAVEYNTNYSRVIDIAEEDDFEIVVGWAQAAPFLASGNLSGPENFSDSSRFTNTSTFFNGILEIDVLNDLVCPAEDAPIQVNVFVSMCEDAKFGGPTNANMNNFHLFPKQVPAPQLLKSQSGMVDGTENPTNQMTDRPTGSNTMHEIASEGEEADHTYSVFFGDPPTTLRELMKRYVQTRSWVTSEPPEGFVKVSTLLNKDAPYHSGWDPEGIDRSDVDNATPLNVGNTDFTSWWTPCFAGVRGARRKKYIFSSPGPQNPSVTRASFAGAGNGSQTDQLLDFTLTDNRKQQKWLSTRTSRESGNGSSITNYGINNTIEVELPFYRDVRFLPARNVRAQSLPSNSHRVVTAASTRSEVANPKGFGTAFQQWDAVGEDFSLFFFTGAPILYNYSVNESS
ncbi:predicted structural protein [Asterionellopsis glacialis RNA virus]|uniref:Predicted structural protein n=1 Tax=Asterionellopsis glacialis RNA virus TaxID=1522179 RepID=A0A077JCA7_9VIRU|nr:predicted structural protein [Asterionellopsis glacialis RNA virus]BAP16720.1 predicted structural protein [Asterionellopsis glacialis RNA virus]